MGTRQMEEIIGRILTDARFREDFEKDKEEVLKDYELTDNEKATLGGLTYSSLHAAILRLVEPMRREKMDWTDYAVGIIGILFSVAVLLVLGYIYWRLHGEETRTFSLWSIGDARWLEVLFWSVFTSLSRGVLELGFEMGIDQQFQKRRLFIFLVSVFQNSIMALATVLVVLNLGVSFGGVTLSLKDTSMEIVIGLTIISAVFAKNTGELLWSVSNWLLRAVKSKLAVEEEGREVLRMVRSVSIFVQNMNAENFRDRADERRTALERKLENVENLIVDGKYRTAMDKLIDDIRLKTDGECGGDPQDDWIVHGKSLELCRRIDDIIGELQKLVG